MDLQQKNISIGLIRKLTDAGWRWLSLWNARQNYFDFITADCIEDESPRESISREVSWTLQLDRGRDILVCNMAQCNLDFVAQIPGDNFETAMKVAFYNVELYRKDAVRQVDLIKDVAWLTSQEICEGRTTDNLAMNPELTYLIARSQVIQHWESST